MMMNLKAMRNAHLYLGVFFTPLLVFFLLTGTWQMFDWHKSAHVLGGPHVQTIIKSLSEVHTDQRFTAGRDQVQSSQALKYLIVVMSLGLLITTLLGVLMAFKYTRAWLVWFCLVAGIIIPIFIIFISKAYGDEAEIILADRKALHEAEASHVASKILQAREQLSDDLSREANLKRKELEGTVIGLTSDGQGHLLAQVRINHKVNASLIVDTGSPVLMLNASFIDKLGVDVHEAKLGEVALLNGKYKAAAISLKSVKINDIQSQDVPGVVLLENNKDVGDGLLGMSFLSRFHFTFDQKGQKLILRKQSHGGDYEN